MPGAVQWKFRFTGPFVLHYVKEEKKSISQSLVACSLRYFKNTHQVSGTKVNFQIIKIYDIKQKKKKIFFFALHPRAYGCSQSELRLPAFTTATARPYLSCVFDLYHSSWQCRILNPLSEARDRTPNLMNTSQVRYCWAMMGTPRMLPFYFLNHHQHYHS